MKYQKCYPKLADEIIKNGDTVTELSEMLNLKIASLSRRLNKIVDFRISEIEFFMNRYKKTYEELFR